MVYLVTVWRAVIFIYDTPQALFWINEIMRGLARAVKLAIVNLVYCRTVVQFTRKASYYITGHV